MVKSHFVQYVVDDLMGGVKGIAARAMFGGYGIYWEGVMFGLIADDVLYFKVDATNRREYEASGSRPFTYQAKGRKKIALSYWEVPATILDDRDALVAWAQKSRKINAVAD